MSREKGEGSNLLRTMVYLLLIQLLALLFVFLLTRNMIAQKKKKEKKKSGKAASPSVVTSEIPTVGRKDSREVITDPINSIIREEKGTKRSGGDCFLMFSWGIERDPTS